MNKKYILMKMLFLFSLFAGFGANAQQVVIGSTSGSADYFYGPYYRSSASSSFNYSRYAYVYTAAELGIPAGSIITNIDWYKSSGTVTGNNTFNIFLNNTSATTVTSGSTWGTLTTGATQVYGSTTQSMVAGANSYETFSLGTPYTYSGGSLLILTDWTKAGTASAGNFYYYNSAVGEAIGIASSSSFSSSTTLSTTYGNSRPTIRITYTPGIACTGTPAAGTATASTSNACAGSSFTLALSGASSGGGLSYQWQSSPAGLNTFTNLGASQLTTGYTVASQTAATDYRVITTCANGGATAVSSIINVGQNNFLTCYCTPINNCTNEYIKTVSLNGYSNNTGVCNGGGYGDFTSGGPVTTLGQGSIYPISVFAHINDANSQVGVWIDYDHSGTFDASEFTLLGTISGTNTDQTFNSSISVPAGALLGTTRMRVRSANGTGVSSTSACNVSNTYGETEDYFVTIGTSTPCTGTPTAGTATSTSTSVCAGVSYTLSATGYTAGVTGITFQWQSSPTGANTFTNIAGATGSAYTVASQTAGTDYRLVVTCTGSGLSANSGIVSVAQSSYFNCYCMPLANSTGDEEITNVTIDNINNSSTCASLTGTQGVATGTADKYSDWTASTVPVPTLSQAVTYGISATLSECSGSNYGRECKVYFDWNHNGLFTDAGESYTIYSYANPSNLNYVATASIAVPATAAPGLTRMRVILNEGTVSDPCANPSWGEVEDYTVKVVVGSACNGTPTPPIASSSVSAVCANTSFTLTATGLPTSTGITYQWQSRPTGSGSFTNIAGATTSPYTVPSQAVSTDYQLVVTCSTTSSQVASNTVSVAQNSFLFCYCGSAATSAADEEILNVTVGTLNNSSTCLTTGTGSSSVQNKYSDYKQGAGAPAAPMLGQTVAIPFSIQVGTCGGNYASGTAIFIDYNQNGVFTDAGEQVYATTGTTSGPHFVTGSFTVPATATLGTTAMRVINSEGNIGTNITPCLSYGYGETEDYLVTITTPPSCAAPTGATVSAIANNSANVSWTCTGCTGTFVVEYGPAGFTPGTGATAGAGGTVITNAVTPQSLGTSLTPSTNYTVYVRQNCGAGSYSFNTPSVNFTTAAACPAPTALVASGVTPVSANVGWTCTSCTGTFVVEYGPTGFTPGTGATAGTGGTVITNATNPQSLGNVLTPGTSYTVYVRQDCGGGTFGANASLVFTTPLLNDDAPGAIALTVGAGCTGAPYTNVNSSQSASEPFSACRGTAGYHTVWYKFVAPVSGAVRVSTDAGSGSTISDSRVSVFSATNVNNYATFTNLSCDDDGGSVGGALSVAYVTGLTGGQTYYVQVDGYSASYTGTFCLTVDQLDTTMIAAGGSCVSAQTTYTTGPGTYTGFVTVQDVNSKLIALIKVPAGMPSTGPSFTSAVSTNTAATRSAVFNGVNQKYLDRNYLISSTVTGATVQFFFLNTELASLTSSDPASTLSKLNVTEQSGGTCQQDFAAANGTNVTRFQTGSGTSIGASWVEVNNASFSNFYLHRSSAIVNATAALQGDVISSGANIGLMRTDLGPGNTVLPTSDPYGLGATYANINNNTGVAGAVVDWVRLEVRNAASLSVPVESRAVLLQPNGNLVDPATGTAPVFDARPYPVRLVVRHRNHLGIMSNTLTPFLDVVNYNFTTSLSQASVLPGDPVQMVQVGGKWCLWAGDVNVGANYAQDYYIETADDAQLQSVLPQSLSGVYNVNDLNLDGYVETADDVLMQLNLPNSLNSTLANY